MLKKQITRIFTDINDEEVKYNNWFQPTKFAYMVLKDNSLVYIGDHDMWYFDDIDNLLYIASAPYDIVKKKIQMPVENETTVRYPETGVIGFDLTHSGTTINISSGELYMNGEKIEVSASSKNASTDWTDSWGSYYIWVDTSGNVTFTKSLMGEEAPEIPANAQLIWNYAVYKNGNYRDVEDRRTIVQGTSIVTEGTTATTIDRLLSIVDFDNINHVSLNYQGQILGGRR